MSDRIKDWSPKSASMLRTVYKKDLSEEDVLTTLREVCGGDAVAVATRILKYSGQAWAVSEVESALQRHPNVVWDGEKYVEKELNNKTT